MNEGATMFFINENPEETTSEVLQNVARVVSLWLRIKLKTQKIDNLLGDADNDSSKFTTRKWYLINAQNNTDYGERNGYGKLLNLKPKLLNQIFVIIQTHIFL